MGRSKKLQELDPNHCHPRDDNDRRDESLAKTLSQHRESLSRRDRNGSRSVQNGTRVDETEGVADRGGCHLSRDERPASWRAQFSNTSHKIGDVATYLGVRDRRSWPVTSNQEAASRQLPVEFMQH
jgi:hypothetical protein